MSTEGLLIGGHDHAGQAQSGGQAAIILSPEERAALQQQQHNAVAQLRVNLAANIMGHLMSVHYARHLNKLSNKAAAGRRKACQNGHGQEQWEPIDVSLPAAIAKESADALLTVMGVLRPRAAQPQAGPGSQSSEEDKSNE